jgi:hypothetical protein
MLRIGLKLFPAARAAEVIIFSFISGATRRCFLLDRHAAHRILETLYWFYFHTIVLSLRSPLLRKLKPSRGLLLYGGCVVMVELTFSW